MASFHGFDERIADAHRHIVSLWPRLTRRDEPGEESRIPLPHPYVMPSTDKFPYLFYWDSYFTIVGLAVDGQRELVRSMVGNFLYELREFGLVLNYNHPASLTRSQPPYLTSMIKEALKGGLDTQSVAADGPVRLDKRPQRAAATEYMKPENPIRLGRKVTSAIGRVGVFGQQACPPPRYAISDRSATE